MALVYFESSQLVLVVEKNCVEFVEKTRKINEINRNKLQIIDLSLVFCARKSMIYMFFIDFR